MAQRGEAVVRGVNAERACNRCTGKNKQGGRCRRTTCRIGPLCWQHAMEKWHVRVKPSKHGYGLFAEKPGAEENEIIFRRNDFICPYADKSHIMDEPPGNIQIPYGLSLGREKMFNPYKTNQNPGRYANDCNNITKIRNGEANYSSAKPCINALLVNKPKEKIAEIQAKKTIRQGDEIFVAYRQDYWGLGVHKQRKQVTGRSTVTVRRPRTRVQRYGQ